MRYAACSSYLTNRYKRMKSYDVPRHTGEDIFKIGYLCYLQTNKITQQDTMMLLIALIWRIDINA